MNQSNFEKVFDDTIRQMAEAAVRDILIRHGGSGVRETAKAVKEEIVNLIRTDVEINELLRKQIIRWIQEN